MQKSKGMRIKRKKIHKMKNKTLLFLLWMAVGAVLISCGAQSTEIQGTKGNEETEMVQYVSISAEEAKQLMDIQQNYVILDVRTEEEYNDSHIPGAILIPDYEIEKRAGKELPDKEQLILVYCRSGRRSKLASQTLAELGYSNIKEFGGIIDWPYEVE